MAIVGAFDVHRRQVTYDVLDTATGQVCRGQIHPACRATLRQFLGRFADQKEVSSLRSSAPGMGARWRSDRRSGSPGALRRAKRAHIEAADRGGQEKS